MISLALAQQLSAAGLHWSPAIGDQFAVPGAGLDNYPFVISEQTAFLQRVNGLLLIAFHGASEWALDHVVVSDVVWLPTETQLRGLLDERLPATAELKLARAGTGYTCTVGPKSSMQSFTAEHGDDAYAMALLHTLASAN